MSLTHILSCVSSLSCSKLQHMKIDREMLTADSRIKRLLNNPNWKPAAEAAMKFLLDGKNCPITSWRKSSSWAQVEMVWEELKEAADSKPPAD